MSLVMVCEKNKCCFALQGVRTHVHTNTALLVSAEMLLICILFFIFVWLCCVRPLASILDEKRAMIVTRYLASGRALSNSFDMYLQQVGNMESIKWITNVALHNMNRVKHESV